MQDADPVCGFFEGRCQVSGTGYLAPGTRYPAPEPVRRRGPDTEHRRPSLVTEKRAHGVCKMGVRFSALSVHARSGSPYPSVSNRVTMKRRDGTPRLPLMRRGGVADGPEAPGLP